MNYLHRASYALKNSFFIATLLVASSQMRADGVQNTVIVFDIHDVLMQQKTMKMIGQFFKHPSLIFKIGELSSGSYGTNPALRKIMNSQKPIKDTWKLVCKLKAAGYPLYIFSNIDATAFQELKQKFPGYFELFEDCQVIHNNDAAAKKPAASSYEQCKAMVAQKHAGKKIVFVDDKKENIQAACKAGLVGLRFTSAAKLTNDLQPHL